MDTMEQCVTNDLRCGCVLRSRALLGRGEPHLTLTIRSATAVGDEQTVVVSALAGLAELSLAIVRVGSAHLFVSFALNLRIRTADLPKSFHQKWSSKQKNENVNVLA
jgi:hypothetical protein